MAVERRKGALSLEGRRRTKIVATAGPAIADDETMRAVIEAGADVVRLNFSHGTHEEHRRFIEAVRRAADSCGRSVAILQDLQGPRIRTGTLVNGGPVLLETDRELVLTTEKVPGTHEVISIDEPRLPEVVSPGELILVDEGRIQLRVLEAKGRTIRTKVERGGLIGEHRGVNVPAFKRWTRAITLKDEMDLRFGLEQGVDYVALSFVRHASDVLYARSLIRAYGDSVPIIAKIESQEALANLREIIATADGIMVARGDLGVELSPERVPAVQKRLIQEANAAGKPVITATQMLESMVERPYPTRAEASDIANAVWDGTDAVMLSAETAIGHYPVQAVQTMARIIGEAESESVRIERHMPVRISYSHAITRAARDLAESIGAKAIVAFTNSGRTAALLSQGRPKVPVLAFTPNARVCRQLSLLWGVTAVLEETATNTETLVARAEHTLLDWGTIAPRDIIVIVGALPIGAPTNFIKIHVVGT